MNVEEKYKALRTKKIVRILGIESSCDETSISVVENGRVVLSNIVSSQIEIHKRFGGVVPEVASRNHIMAISNVLDEALNEAKLTLKDIDAIAVTYGAGLVGALLVGVNFAKALAYSLDIPLIAVSHVMGHIAANYLSHENLKPPFICLMVSGGHSAILNVMNYNEHEKLGQTVDDAVGEAFDKVARVLGLEYPGGPNIDRLAKQGKNIINFARSNVLKGTYDFSFSGIKTAVINYVHNLEQKGQEINKADVAMSFQEYVVNELSNKAIKACIEKNVKKLVVAGGVGANSRLKEILNERCRKENIELFMPKLNLCTDNAAMIASAGYYYMLDSLNLGDLTLTAMPTVKL